MKISQEVELDFNDVLIQPNRSTISSRATVYTEREFYFYHSPRKWIGVPIICSNMASVAGFDMAKALSKNKIITCLHKYIDINDYGAKADLGQIDTDYVWPTIGMSDKQFEDLYEMSLGFNLQPNICIDVPSGYMEEFVNFCKKVRDKFPLSIIMAGNVVSGDMAQELVIHGGVDIVKVGIGPGSNCSTRAVTGVGRAQLSATLDVSYNVHGLRYELRHLGLMCTDGGLRNSGDICKAYVAGADFVMLGGMFAGTDECCGEWEYNVVGARGFSTAMSTNNITKMYKEYGDKKLFLKHYGMSTHYAQEVNGTGKKDYRASEGVVTKVPYKGPVQNTVDEILGGIRSCCSYIGAQSIKEMSRCGRFVQVNRIHDDFGRQKLGQ